ncbi:MAG: mechanosensitive ion channel family protein [Opitutaceae bacterium]|nr:mechanosensitive ion channel family protein [Opitutaceae bacterium]
MIRRFLLLCGVALGGLAVVLQAQPAPESTPPTVPDASVAAAAAVSGGYTRVESADFLEHLVDTVLELFDVRSSGNTATHYAIAALFLVGSFVLRRLVTRILFGFFRKLAAKTRTTLDDKLFPALEAPVGAFIALVGALAALKVLKLSAASDQVVRYGSTMAFSLVLFWLLLRAFNTLLVHVQEVATERQLGIAAFMPWIRKTLVVVFVIFGVLMVAQSLGADVKAFLAGLGIGGLAFALAAQDTLANLFGSVVVAVDQPFKIGEFVRIGGNSGMVEDIGLRSTKLRGADKSLTIVPNKAVASESVVNLSRFTQRRVEQVIGLTYSSKAGDLQSIVDEFKAIILAQEEIDPTSVMVYFRDFSASSLDIWVVYMTKDGDFKKHMQVRQAINLAFMRCVEARGLAFAFPSQSIYLEGEVGRLLGGGEATAKARPPAP